MKYKILILPYLGYNQNRRGPKFGASRSLTYESESEDLDVVRREVAEALGVKVREVGRPKKKSRKMRGKSNG